MRWAPVFATAERMVDQFGVDNSHPPEYEVCMRSCDTHSVYFGPVVLCPIGG
jgi:hypothetical protein